LRTAAFLALALCACTSRTAIRPDQLPIVTNAAAEDPKAPVEVVDAEGQRTELTGRFDAVAVTRAGIDEKIDRFEAPVTARFEGPLLRVNSHTRQGEYTSAMVRRVEVERYQTTRAIVSGSILTSFGGTFLVAGAVFMGAFLAKDDEYSAFGLVGGIPMMSIGLGLAGGGIPLLVAGSRDSR
jgi:hypothetical protein